MDLAEQFDIEDLVAEGLGGDLWSARDVRTGHAAHVAVLDASAPASLREQFVPVAQKLIKIDHPNLTRVLVCAFDAEQNPCAVLERPGGPTLHAWLESNRGLDEAAMAGLIRGIAEGVAALHEADVVHGDIEPGNVLVVTREGTPIPKLAGFGLNHAYVRSGQLEVAPSDAAALRSLAHASPAQAAGALPARAHDVYGVGAILHTMLHGEPPRTATDLPGLRQALARPLADAAPSGEGVRGRLEELSRRTLSGDIGSAARLLEALVEITRSPSPPKAAPARAAGSPDRSAGRPSPRAPIAAPRLIIPRPGSGPRAVGLQARPTPGAAKKAAAEAAAEKAAAEKAAAEKAAADKAAADKAADKAAADKAAADKAAADKAADKAAADKAAADKAAADKAAADKAAADKAAADKAAADKAAADKAAADKAAADKAAADKAAADKAAADRAAAEQAAAGRAALDKAAAEEAAAHKAAADKVAADKAAAEQAAAGRAALDKAAADEAAAEAAVAEEGDPNKTDPNKTDPNKTAPSKTDASKTDPNKTAPSKTDASKTDPNKTAPREPDRDEATQGDDTRPLDGVPTAVTKAPVTPPETGAASVRVFPRAAESTERVPPPWEAAEHHPLEQAAAERSLEWERITLEPVSPEVAEPAPAVPPPPPIPSEVTAITRTVDPPQVDPDEPAVIVSESLVPPPIGPDEGDTQPAVSAPDEVRRAVASEETAHIELPDEPYDVDPPRRSRGWLIVLMLLGLLGLGLAWVWANRDTGSEPRGALPETLPTTVTTSPETPADPASPPQAQADASVPEPRPDDTSPSDAVPVEPPPALDVPVEAEVDAGAPANRAAPASRPRPRPRRPLAELEAEARQCTLRGDNVCVIRLLRGGRARSPGTLALLIEAHRARGGTAQAIPLMRAFVERYPGHPRSTTYRRILDR